MPARVSPAARPVTLRLLVKVPGRAAENVTSWLVATR
jgi:hypothetical protein